jgi:hypothetical protein
MIREVVRTELRRERDSPTGRSIQPRTWETSIESRGLRTALPRRFAPGKRALSRLDTV